MANEVMDWDSAYRERGRFEGPPPWNIGEPQPELAALLAAVQSGGGAGTGSIAIAARAGNGEVELSVQDSGVGFQPAEGARLFQKFTRLNGGAGYYGTGLGLFIVRRLMELAQGRVSAHSDGVGQGAKLTLTWPAAGQGPQL